MSKNFEESAEAFYQAGHSLVKLLLDITKPDFDALRKRSEERIKNTMTHDIAHCNNETCPAKDRCKRYAVYIEDIENHFPLCSYLHHTEAEIHKIADIGSCIHFLEYNNK